MTVTAHRRLLSLLAALLASALLTGNASGHATLVSSSPADGARVAAGQVRTVALTFDDELDAAKSQFELVDGGGTTVATGKVGADVRTMTADGLALAPGSYEARWTAATSDGHITRGIVSFLATAGATSSAPAASDSGASRSAPNASPAAASSMSAAPDPSAVPGAPAPQDAGDVVVPITAAAAFVTLVAVLTIRRSRAA